MSLIQRHSTGEDEETDENGVFTSEDSIRIRQRKLMQLTQRHLGREQKRMKTTHFTSEDSIEIRRASKGVEKKTTIKYSLLNFNIIISNFVLLY